MACVDMPLRNVDSEMEEGEIVDDLDDLSDISSEEEFLLRQRLQVLENYNNVLERKKAKTSFSESGKRREDVAQHDLSEISATEFEDNFPQVSSNAKVIVYKNNKEQKHPKTHHKQKKKKDIEHKDLGRNKDHHKKKSNRKKKVEVQIISETSDESDDEYRNKRRKLANAVAVNKEKNDKSSLHTRLQKMLWGGKAQNASKAVLTEDKETETDAIPKLENVSCSPILPSTPVPIDISVITVETQDNIVTKVEDSHKVELVDLCTDDDSTVVNIIEHPKSKETIDSVVKSNNDENDKLTTERDSDEDLELLRQYALKTKVSKLKPQEPENKVFPLSEDEDSDTAELRLICLKSALLKKAIEMKQKQKLKKRLSQSSNLQDDLLNEQTELINKIDTTENNTDIESVDMDIGSEGEEKVKDSDCKSKIVEHDVNTENDKIIHGKYVSNSCQPTEDELEEDEDLLRAKLLTSLSKNLPNLVDPQLLCTVDDVKTAESTAPAPKTKVNVPEEKRIVINLGESDSEGEHEATKNLTKMHLKLSEQIDFQQKLDMFLKSTRMEVEKTALPNDVQNPTVQKPAEKFVAKAVNHLPKSEQIEYKNLVKRMAELEKIKQARHTSMSLLNKPPFKETLKPRNFSVDSSRIMTVGTNLEEQIALSRKKIAEESAKMLNIKNEAVKLSQKYKIVTTELRNITTAITLNKKEQRLVQNKLSKIRAQHQKLLKLSISQHSKTNGHLPANLITNKNMFVTKLQKENDPSTEEYKNFHIQRSLKISVANDLNDTAAPNSNLSVEVDVSCNKKIVKVPSKDKIVDLKKEKDNIKENSLSLPIIDKDSCNRRINEETDASNDKTVSKKESNDYESPLQALETATWQGDPNAILCPFEVGGNCKDSDCKYLHPKILSKQ